MFYSIFGVQHYNSDLDSNRFATDSDIFEISHLIAILLQTCNCQPNPIQLKTGSRLTQFYCCVIAVLVHQSLFGVVPIFKAIISKAQRLQIDCM